MTKLPTLVVMFSGLARSGRTTLMRGLIERYASQREIFDHARMRARLHVDGRHVGTQPRRDPHDIWTNVIRSN